MDSIIIESPKISIFPEYGVFICYSDRYFIMIDSLFRRIDTSYSKSNTKYINIEESIITIHDNTYVIQSNYAHIYFYGYDPFYKQLYEKMIQTYDFIKEGNKLIKCPNMKSILRQLDSNLIQVYSIISNMAVKDVSNIIFANLANELYYDRSKFKLQNKLEHAKIFDL